jgi:hypothetical protein
MIFYPSRILDLGFKKHLIRDPVSRIGIRNTAGILPEKSHIAKDAYTRHYANPDVYLVRDPDAVVLPGAGLRDRGTTTGGTADRFTLLQNQLYQILLF